MLYALLVIILSLVLHNDALGMKRQTSSSLDLTNTTHSPLSQLPQELIPYILVEAIKDKNSDCYDQLPHIEKLKSVCQHWQTILSDPKFIAANNFYISPMHRAAKNDDWRKILELKDAGHSLYVYDDSGCSPLCYAYRSKALHAMTFLEIGHAHILLIEKHAKNHGIKPTIQPMPGDLTDLKKAVENNNITDTIEVLYHRQDDNSDAFKALLTELRDAKDTSITIRDVIKYALQSRTEADLFDELVQEESIISNILELFHLFEEFECNPTITFGNNFR